MFSGKRKVCCNGQRKERGEEVTDEKADMNIVHLYLRKTGDDFVVPEKIKEAMVTVTTVCIYAGAELSVIESEEREDEIIRLTGNSNFKAAVY